MTTEHKSTTSQAPRQGNTVADWQPIETAPKDGTWLLLHHPEWLEPELAQWSGGWVDYSFGRVAGATHWAYLPPPPATEEQ